MTPLPPGIRMMLPCGAFGRNNTAFEPPMLTVSSAPATLASTIARAAATAGESHPVARSVFRLIANVDIRFVIPIPILMIGGQPASGRGLRAGLLVFLQPRQHLLGEQREIVDRILMREAAGVAHHDEV